MFPGNNGLSRNLWKTTWNDLGPRLGAAYRLGNGHGDPRRLRHRLRSRTTPAGTTVLSPTTWEPSRRERRCCPTAPTPTARWWATSGMPRPAPSSFLPAPIPPPRSSMEPAASSSTSTTNTRRASTCGTSSSSGSSAGPGLSPPATPARTAPICSNPARRCRTTNSFPPACWPTAGRPTSHQRRQQSVHRECANPLQPAGGRCCRSWARIAQAQHSAWSIPTIRTWRCSATASSATRESRTTTP